MSWSVFPPEWKFPSSSRTRGKSGPISWLSLLWPCLVITYPTYYPKSSAFAEYFKLSCGLTITFTWMFNRYQQLNIPKTKFMLPAPPCNWNVLSHHILHFNIGKPHFTRCPDKILRSFFVSHYSHVATCISANPIGSACRVYQDPIIYYWYHCHNPSYAEANPKVQRPSNIYLPLSSQSHSSKTKVRSCCYSDQGLWGLSMSLSITP